MSDAEMFLMCWAVVATVLALKWKSEKDSLGHMLNILFMKPEARKEIFTEFDEFKAKHGL
jgi:hypothetical protein